VIDYSSGTIDAGNCCSFGDRIANIGAIVPYAIQNTAGSRARTTDLAVYGYGSTGTAYGRPVQSIATITYNSGSNPIEYAMRWVMPASTLSQYTVAGLRQSGTIGTASLFDLVLYDGTTALQSTSIDTDANQSGGRRDQLLMFSDTTLSTLAAASTYRLAMKANASTANNLVIYAIDVATNADLAAWPGGIELYSSTRNGGAWTDVNTRRFMWEAMIDSVTAASGGIIRVGPSGGLVQSA